MSETERSVLVQLRAAVRAAERVLRDAEAREATAKKALASGQAEASRTMVAAAVAERERAEGALEEARAELENLTDDEREANADDPIPQTDYWVHEIVAKLSHYRQRATYEAVGGLRSASAPMVRAWFAGREAPDNSFIVKKATGEPSDYPPSRIHPALGARPGILTTPDDLLAWLQTHPLVIR